MEQDFPLEEMDDAQLRMENELLRIKLQAELGAHFCGMEQSSLPPQMERMFLEQIAAFHKHIAENPAIPLRQHLGNPDLRPSGGMPRRELEQAWKELSRLLESKNVRVDFLGRYPTKTMYDFILDELLDCEIETPIFENQYVCFIYEEFHPDHEYDLRKISKEFMAAFFQKRLRDVSWPLLLSDQLYVPDLDPMPLKDLYRLVDRFHGMFESITAFEVDLKQVQVEEEKPSKPDEVLLGYTEGQIRYWVKGADQQEQLIEGPFRLYLQLVLGGWEIFNFELYGFSWVTSTFEVDGYDDRPGRY